MNIKEESKDLKYKMYGMVPFQLSGVQSGIQFQHAVSRYQRDYPGDITDKWAYECETSILLDGGSTNTHPDRLGTLNKHLQTLQEMNVIVSTFHEVTLGDQLTAIAFLIDERVYDKDMYPDFVFERYEDKLNPSFTDKVRQKEWEEYLDMIGGFQKHRLRMFLRPFKLAS